MRIPTIIVSITLLGSLTYAQYGEFQIGDEPPNPRVSAMGSAGTALSGKGFCFYNPASPAFAPAPFVSAEFGQLPGDMSKSMVETAWMFPQWFVGASLRVQSTDFGITTEQTSDPAGAPLGSDQTMQATLTGGFTFCDGRFAFGNSLNFYHEQLYDNVLRAWTWSPGIVFRLIQDRVTLGASMLNYVRLDTVLSPWYKTPKAWYQGAWGLPRYARAGVAWTDTLRSESMPFTLACDFVYSDVYDRLLVPIGGELWITPYLAARAGMQINHPTDRVHFGAGVRWSNIVFDFDYGITQPVAGADIESKWLFALTYNLKSTATQKIASTPLPQKKAFPAPEPVQFAPPKRILLTPKHTDSLKVLPSVKDTVHAQIPDSTKTATNSDTSATNVPDSSVSRNTPLPQEKSVAPDTTSGKKSPIVPLPSGNDDGESPDSQ
jgi:hypothetical protein